jgi:hypothetical protein
MANTTLAILGLILVGVGIVAIGVGFTLAIVDHVRTQRAREKAAGTSVTQPYSVSETLKSLAEVLKVLTEYPFGLRLAGFGFIAVILGAGLAVGASLTG